MQESPSLLFPFIREIYKPNIYRPATFALRLRALIYAREIEIPQYSD